MYYRLTASNAINIYKILEPLYADYRRMVIRKNEASTGATSFKVMHMDEFIDKLLKSDRFCDISLPRMNKRCVLEENGDLEPYETKLNLKV